jgi:hypothetical protein
MAFDIKGLFKVADGGGGRNYWQYVTADTHATVDTAGYFAGADALAMLRIGDIIDVIVGTLAADYSMTAVTTYGRHIVNQNNGTQIDVSDVTVGNVTDTD